jgi:hypothetical protein
MTALIRKAVRRGQVTGTWRAAASTTLLLAVTAACASTGATFRSGVGDTFLEHPPWYGGSFVEAAGERPRMGHLPVAYQRGATHADFFDPTGGPSSPVSALLTEMNDFLDSLATATGLSVRLVEGRRASAVAPTSMGTPPDVQFGCRTDDGTPFGDCAERDEGALGRNRQPMRLAVGRPSPEWITWMGGVMQAQGVERALVLTLEVGQYLPRQRGLLGRKEVELGTGHTVSIPWLTSLETPVTVLQLTGALMGADGKAIRIGSEGFHARRTRLLVSAVGGQEVLTNDDVTAARTARRDDMPGAPLAWQVALRHLVARLADQGAVAP